MDPITMSLVAGAISSLSDSGDTSSDVSTSDLLALKQAEQEQKAKQQRALIYITVAVVMVVLVIVGILVYKKSKR